MSEKVKPHTFGGARFIGRDQIIPVKKVFIDFAIMYLITK